MNGWTFHKLRRNVTREAQMWLMTSSYFNSLNFPTSQTELYTSWNPPPAEATALWFTAARRLETQHLGRVQTKSKMLPHLHPHFPTSDISSCVVNEKRAGLSRPRRHRSQGTMPPCASGSSTWLRVWARLHPLFYLLHVSSPLMCHTIKTCSNNTVTMCKTSVLFMTTENISKTMTLKIHQ